MNWLKKIFIKDQEILKYILFGVLTTVVNIAVFFLFDTVLNFSYMIANVISIIAAILFAFFTNKKYVFKAKSQSWKLAFKEFYLFVGLRSVSGLFDMLSMFMLVDFMNLETNLSKILTQFIIVVLNYIFSKLYIFR
ncbi:GtrA family protein [Lacicoccus qingdaonensis]|uniref:Putative flippase GtrA (Transmembrane translocase of bactoprenol-linked glucose) n=1 Tax=Lacicoccus qingdaonensis TaxID=576118 RepID=A0A1G9D7R2_9BACL|nr:GtrA family protein [Salinicoccus qingdaonensis]SDK59891.1 Putative flippase GtrA (transmembrane translocase of bactoprenol-linked glucose) [Salinicoccus qingdaonensis]